MSLRVLIAGGGTGGHLFPGLAVAEELRRQGAEVSFVGTERGIEARVVPPLGYPLLLIDVAGLKGRGLKGVRDALRWPRTILQTLRLLHRLRPHVVVGVGGYASGPVVLLAAILRIPTAVLEQNSVPGVTNRILGRVVRLVFTAFPEAERFFPERRIRRFGNPIRRSLSGVTRVAAPGAPRVLVLGGSQGAHAVNELFAGAIAHLHEAGLPVPRLHHQSGKADEPVVRTRYAALGLQPEAALVSVFIDDMARAYGEADLIVGRAGATTIAEMTALGLPSILIPFPQAADDHQTKNARFLEAEGAAKVLLQAEASPQKLAEIIHALCADPIALARMAKSSARLGRPKAAAAVADALVDLAGPMGG